MVYQHPMAYLLGLQGEELLLAFAGEHDQAFVEARFKEMGELLASTELLGSGTTLPPVSTVDGYATWSTNYDEPGNALIDIEGPIVQRIIDELPVGSALDVACGTGRHTQYLAKLGHRTVGIDGSPEML